MPENTNISTAKFLFLADIIAVVATLPFLLFPWWVYLKWVYFNAPAEMVQAGHLPGSLLFMISDALPFLVGFSWLVHRYRAIPGKTIPMLRGGGLSLLIGLVFFAIPLCLIKTTPARIIFISE